MQQPRKKSVESILEGSGKKCWLTCSSAISLNHQPLCKHLMETPSSALQRHPAAMHLVLSLYACVGFTWCGSTSSPAGPRADKELSLTEVLMPVATVTSSVTK